MLENIKKWNFWLVGALLLLITLFFVSLLMLCLQVNPLSFWKTIFINPLTSLVSFSNLIETYSVLILTGLAVAITFKYRIYNFGVTGQMLFSAMVTYVLAVAIYKSGGYSQLITPFLLLIAVLIGGLAGLIIAILKTYFKIHEIISTILFNFIAWEGYKGLITSNAYHNLKIPTQITNLRFSLISGPFSISNLFSAGIIIAIIVLLIAIIIFNNRTLGFKLNAIAKNPVAAKYARLNPQYQGLIILPISGAIAGIAGYLYFLGVNNNLPSLSAPIQEGFYGIVVAALAGYTPGVILFSSFFMSLFISPIENNAFMYLKNPEIAIIILSITIYIIGIYPFIWHYLTHSVAIKEYLIRVKKKLIRKKEIIEEEQQKVKIVNIELKSSKFLKKDKIFKKKRRKK
ncbi:ABC transporter permease [Spiroplasma endosymbiont of Notiophilus biguttatus]|uniref:ABC transporter permease n=1 Tax=Spiroplasma endosymbiont of Notiophilus biguttatus TaxID=3066285 RepID=UPI00313DE01F